MKTRLKRKDNSNVEKVTLWNLCVDLLNYIPTFPYMSLFVYCLDHKTLQYRIVRQLFIIIPSCSCSHNNIFHKQWVSVNCVYCFFSNFIHLVSLSWTIILTDGFSVRMEAIISHIDQPSFSEINQERISSLYVMLTVSYISIFFIRLRKFLFISLNFQLKNFIKNTHRNLIYCN